MKFKAKPYVKLKLICLKTYIVPLIALNAKDNLIFVLFAIKLRIVSLTIIQIPAYVILDTTKLITQMIAIVNFIFFFLFLECSDSCKTCKY
jgi:hypothetical protein